LKKIAFPEAFLMEGRKRLKVQGKKEGTRPKTGIISKKKFGGGASHEKPGGERGGGCGRK